MLFSAACILYTAAQPLKIDTHDLQQLSLKQPTLIGKVGSRYMLCDIPGKEGCLLFLLDSNFSLVKKVYLPAEAFVAYKREINGELRLSWIVTADKKTGYPEMKIIQVSRDGEVHTLVNDKIKQYLQTKKNIPRITTDLMHQRELLYSFRVDTLHVYIDGLIIDPNGLTVKELTYEIDYDPEQDQLPLVQLDKNGNVHVVTYKRLSSYSMSSSITVNTIPYSTDSIVTESFLFDRVKFGQLLLSDNPESESISLQGFYYDGAEKNKKKGIASVSFQYVRGTAPVTIFNRFPDMLRQQLQKGLKHIRKQDDVMNSITRKDLVRQNGVTFMSYWVPDVSELDLPYGYDAENSGGGLLNAPFSASADASERLMQTATLNRWLNDAERLGSQLTIVPPLYVLPENIPNQYPVFSEPSMVTPVVGNGLSGDEYNRIMNNMDRSGNGKLNFKIKLMSFCIDSAGRVPDYTIIGYDFFQESGGINFSLLRYPVYDGKSMQFMGNVKKPDTGIGFTLVKPMNDAPLLDNHPLPCDQQPVLGTPVQTGRQQYISLAKISNPLNQYFLLMFGW